MTYARNASSRLILIALAAVVLHSPAWAQLDDNCLVAILNRTAQVRPNGTWDLPNIPAGFGPVRARATCVRNGITTSGQSDPFTISPNRMNAIPPILLGSVASIPSEVTITAPKTQLTTPNESVQLTVTARYPDNSVKNITAASTGTTYIISNPAIATITPAGMVTAKSSGTVLVQAQNEGATGLLSISAVL